VVVITTVIFFPIGICDEVVCGLAESERRECLITYLKQSAAVNMKTMERKLLFKNISSALGQ
jgi:hypothetical protein